MYKFHLKDNGNGEFQRTWFLRGDYPPLLNGKPMTEERAEILRQGKEAGLTTENVGKWHKQRKPVFRSI